MTKLPYKWFDHCSDLPQWLLAGIGQIMVDWSILERELEELIRLLMDKDIQVGRITTVGMNARNRMLVATNFVQARVYEGKLDPAFLDEIITLTNKIRESIEGKRNLVAHGVWCRYGTRWHVLRTTGAREVPQLKPAIKKLSRSVLPKSESVDSAKLNDIRREIVTATDAIVSFCRRVGAALPTLQHKPPLYTRRRRPIPAGKSKTRPARRRSSRP